MNNPDVITGHKDADELAALIDKLISNGSSHINIISDEHDSSIKVETVKSTDICGIKGACCQPNEDAIDDDDD